MISIMSTEKIREICQDLVLSDETLIKIRDLLNAEIERGLGKETNPSATIKCFPTYVRHLPTGQESGKFLALDLGGTNFRILLVDLGNGLRDTKTISKTFIIPASVMVGPGEDLFDYIAQSLSAFMRENHVGNERLPLGFTFSFACRQEGLTKAVLMNWTKGFKCSDVEGHDVVSLLENALNKLGNIQIEIVAVMNDTTATLMSCAYENPACRIGVIIGTGTNACYVEKLDKVELWNGDMDEPRQVIINSEWGAFGDDGCLDFMLTKFDHEMDNQSVYKDTQVFEKMISGMYLGEVAGTILRRLSGEGLIFNGRCADRFMEQGSFISKYISDIESDDPGCYDNCRNVLEELGIFEYSDEDCENIRYVCELVSRRSAELVGAGIACLLNRIQEDRAVVAVDGSVYKFHPHYRNIISATIEKLIDTGLDFEVILSEGGSGKGAAIVSATHMQKLNF